MSVLILKKEELESFGDFRKHKLLMEVFFFFGQVLTFWFLTLEMPVTPKSKKSRAVL